MREPVMLASPMSALAPTPERAIALASGPGWVGEVKLDGIRAVLRRQGRTVVITNRRGEDITYRYPDVVTRTLALAEDDFVADGEIVVVLGQKISFAAVHRRDAQSDAAKIAAMAQQVPASFIAFDLLELDGVDLRARPLWARRARLEQLDLNPVVHVRNIAALWEVVTKRSMEGIVVKRLDSIWTPRRSRDWVKIRKLHRVSAFVTGTVAGKGSRARDFGALSLGVLDERGGMVHIGNVGAGFTRENLAQLAAAVEAGTVIVEVEFLEIAPGGLLRQPVFKGVRTDVAPETVTTAQLPACRRAPG